MSMLAHLPWHGGHLTTKFAIAATLLTCLYTLLAHLIYRRRVRALQMKMKWEFNKEWRAYLKWDLASQIVVLWLLTLALLWKLTT